MFVLPSKRLYLLCQEFPFQGNWRYQPKDPKTEHCDCSGLTGLARGFILLSLLIWRGELSFESQISMDDDKRFPSNDGFTPSGLTLYIIKKLLSNLG